MADFDVTTGTAAAAFGDTDKFGIAQSGAWRAGTSLQMATYVRTKIVAADIASGAVAITNGGTGQTAGPAALAALGGFTTTATAAGTTTLVAANPCIQVFTGATTQTVVLPVTSTLATGWIYQIVNQSSGALTVNSSGANLVATIPANTTWEFICVLTTGTTAASWAAAVIGNTALTGTGSVVLSTSPTLVTPTLGAASATSLASTGNVTISGTGSLGYATGAGGAVTQGTSRTTTVIVNKSAGAITMFSAAGSATWATFTVTNSQVAATDTIVLSVKSATNLYILSVTAVGSGSFNISFATTGGTSTDAPVINFAVVKAVAA